MTDLIGQTLLNRYRIAELLGHGGMAQVYKTWDQQRTVFLAMKVLHDDLARDKVFLRRFAREAQILDKLQHPHIVRFYGLEQEGLQAFLLMDYIQGSTLRDEIFQLDQAMTGKRILEIIRPICSALHYAHQMGLVHCDIKPANIMIQNNGNVLVADFGIARLIENSTTTTMAGAGTPAYMSPEQVLGKKPSPQTDVYALGIMLYEMLTGGERPFTGDQAQEGGSATEKVRWEHLQVKPPSPRQYNPDLSPQMEAVVLKCLEKNPVQRYVGAMDLLTALEKSIFLQWNDSPEENKTGVTFLPPRAALPQEQRWPNNIVEDSVQKKNNKILIGISISLLVIISAVFGFMSLGGVSALMPSPSSTSMLTATVPPSSTPTDTPSPTNTFIPLTATEIRPTPTPTITPTPAFVDCLYKVQSGDSIYAISAGFSVNSDAIKDVNGASIINPDVLFVGKELLILSAPTSACLEKGGVPKGGAVSVAQASSPTFIFNSQPTTPYYAPVVVTTTVAPYVITTTIAPPQALPDLIVKSAWFTIVYSKSCVMPGESGQKQSSMTISNIGQSSAANFMVDFNGSTQSYNGQLAPGQDTTLTGFSAADFNANIYVDSANRVLESNENNNSWKNFFPIPTQLPPCTPTFTPTSVPAPQISLGGTWTGSGYTCGGTNYSERVQVQDFGNGYFVATKIDGDPCVGGGVKTWEGTYNNPGNNFPFSFGVSVWIKDTNGSTVAVGRTAYMPNANRIEIQMSSYLLVFTR